MGNEFTAGCGVLFILTDGDTEDAAATLSPFHEHTVNLVEEVISQTFRAAIRDGNNLGKLDRAVTHMGDVCEAATQVLEPRVVFVEDNGMVELLIQPIAKPFQAPEVDHKAALVWWPHKLEFKGPVVPVDQGAMPGVIGLAVREWQVVKPLGTGGELHKEEIGKGKGVDAIRPSKTVDALSSRWATVEG